MRDTSGSPRASSGALPAIVIGGVTAGILDILFAFIFYGLRGATPIRILQSIASGLLGRNAFEGGLATSSLGSFLQLLIPTVAAAVYFGLTRVSPALRQHPVAGGLLAGVVIYGVMNLVVVPLSAFPFPTKFPLGVLVPCLLGHMLLVGLPISLANREWAGARPRSSIVDLTSEAETPGDG